MVAAAQVVAQEVARGPAAIIADQDEIPGTGRAVQCGSRLSRHRRPAPGTIVVTYGVFLSCRQTP